MHYEPLLQAGRYYHLLFCFSFLLHCLHGLVVGLASLLTSLGFGGGLFERLGNVLDSGGWDFIPFC
jgi:hypothetical protein